MKRVTKKILSYTVTYKKSDEGGYVVFVPALPGCHSQGETIEEAERNIKEAIELYVESLSVEGEHIPNEESVFQGIIQIAYPSMV